MANNLRHIVGRPSCFIPVFLILVVGAGLSITAFFVGQRWEHGENTTEFDYAAVHPVEAIRRATERMRLVHDALREYYYGSPTNVTRNEFVAAAVSFFPYVPSLKLWQWAPRVADADRDRFEAAAGREMGNGFRISQMDSQGRLVCAGRRAEYFPILYGASQSNIQPRLGWDLASSEVLQAAMDRCRDRDELIVTGRWDVDERLGQGAVVLTLFPVYRHPRLTFTVEDRRRELEGFIVGACSVETFIEYALSYDSGPRGVDMRVFDESAAAGKSFLYLHNSRLRREGDLPVVGAASMPSLADIMYQTSLNFGGRRWSLVCTPAPNFFAAHAQWRSRSALGTGMFFTVLIAAYVYSVTTRRERIERTVVERTLELRRMDERLRQTQEMRTRDIRIAHEETIHRLVTASLCRDEETGMHIKRTGLLSEALARAAGWSEADAEIIRLAAPMHDVGKIGIPDAVLRKPGKLTPAEFETMKRHTIIGAKMLEGSESAMLAMARDIAYCHHERWDGEGYPRGLGGNAIPEPARIVSIVDVYDALSHDRIYHQALSEDEVLNVLRNGSGRQFDPLLLAVFLAHFEEMRHISQENPDVSHEELDAASIFSLAAGGEEFRTDQDLNADFATATAADL